MSTNIFSILRFTAAVIVVFFHQKYRFEYLNNLPSIFIAGPQMVTFFFVLSGFVLVVASGRNKKIRIKNFYIKRIIRIYPLYFISLLWPVFFLIKIGKFDSLNLIVNLSLLQSWIPPYPFTINGPAWYLSDLMFYYFTFPIIIQIINRYKVEPIKLFYISLFLWLLAQIILTIFLNSNFYQGFPSVSHDLLFYFPLSHFPGFLMGVSGALMILNHDSLTELIHGMCTKIFFITLFLIIIIVGCQNEINELLNLRLPYGSCFYAPLFILLIGSVFFLEKAWKAEGDKLKLIAFLGSVSYPIYILQSPVSSFVVFLSKRYPTNKFMELSIFLIALYIVSAVYVKYMDKGLRNFLESKLLFNVARQEFYIPGETSGLKKITASPFKPRNQKK